MHRLEISLLGPFRVTLDGEPVTRFEADTARALLAYLALHTNAPCRRETLAGLLWPEQPEVDARHNLRTALNRVRNALDDKDGDPPFLLATRKTVQLNPESDPSTPSAGRAYWVDVGTFDELIAACQPHHHRRLETCRSCMGRLGEAVALYRGDLLCGFSLDSAPFEEWLVSERERRHRQALDALCHLAAYHERRGEYGQVHDYVRRQLELERWREDAHRQLMRTLALSGQRGAALAQYEACCQVLSEELGVEPEEETTALCERIRDGGLGDLSRAPPHNLPVPVTPFVGRETEMAEIEERLGDPDCRLLTLVGPGGIGKTRLALEAASAQVDAFEHGVFFVPFAPLQSVDTIVPTVARTIGFSFYEGGEPRQQLLDYLRQRSMLLILDNFEHLLDGVGLVTETLRTAQGVHVLVTSRERLNVQGEYLFPVTGMVHPEGRAATAVEPMVSSAVRLFLHGARRVRPDFQPTEEDLAQVGRICRLVEGMPLGILLAASLMEMLSPAEIAAEVEQGIDVLASDLRDVPARQRSIRALLDHSWNLLTERQQEVLRALSVFRGGFTRQAAQAVSGATLRDLMALTHKSLLRRTGDGSYDLWHELLRQYAAEKLAASDSADAVHDAHCAYYCAALEQWGTDLKGPRQQEAVAQIDVEIENVRAAWVWAADHRQIERVDRGMEGLCLYDDRRARYLEGHSACWGAAERLEATACGDGLRVLAKALAWQGVFADQLGDRDRGGQLFKQSLALLESHELMDVDARSERAFALLQMGEWERRRDCEQASALLKQSLHLYQELGDRSGVADALAKLTKVALIHRGDYGEATRLCEQSLAIRRSLGDQGGVSAMLFSSALIAQCQGELEKAERLQRESVVICRRMGDRYRLALGLENLGGILASLGKYAEAHRHGEEAEAILSALGLSRPPFTVCEIMMHLGWYEQARDWLQVTLASYWQRDDRLEIGLCYLWLGLIALALETHAAAQGFLEESIAVFRELGVPLGQSEALALLEVAARGLNEPGPAGQHLYDALRIAAETWEAERPRFLLPTTAVVLADRGQVEHAVELYALALRDPRMANSRWYEDVFGQHIAAAAAHPESVPPDAVAAAAERGRVRDLEVTVEELLAKLAEKQRADAL